MKGKRQSVAFIQIAPDPFYTPDRRCSTCTVVKEIKSHKKSHLVHVYKDKHRQSQVQALAAATASQIPPGTGLPAASAPWFGGNAAISTHSLLCTSLCSTGATWHLTYVIPALPSKRNQFNHPVKNQMLYLPRAPRIVLDCLAFYLQIAPSLKYTECCITRKEDRNLC